MVKGLSLRALSLLSLSLPLLLHQWLPTRGSVWNSPKRINNAVQFSKEGTKNYICNYNKRKKIIRKHRRILLRLANLCLPRNPTYLDGGRRRRSWAKKEEEDGDMGDRGREGGRGYLTLVVATKQKGGRERWIAKMGKGRKRRRKTGSIDYCTGCEYTERMEGNRCSYKFSWMWFIVEGIKSISHSHKIKKEIVMRSLRWKHPSEDWYFQRCPKDLFPSNWKC